MRTVSRYHKNRIVLRGPGGDDAKGAKNKGGNNRNTHTTEVAVETTTTSKETKASSTPISSSATPAPATATKATSNTKTTSTKATSTSSSTKKSSKSTQAAGKSTAKTSTASSSSSTATIAASAGSGSSSTHAIIAVGASVAAVLIVAVALWFLRKWLLQKNAAKRQTWRASLHSHLEAKRNTYADASGALNEKDTSSLRPLMAESSLDTPITPIPPALPSPPAPAVIPAAALSSFGTAAAAPSATSQTAVSATPAAVTPLVMSPGLSIPALSVSPAGTTSPVALAASPTSPRGGPRREAAMVIRTFVPTLTDELPVTIGDTVWIEEAFDDGWCSCTNSGGQAGVVPLECLQSMSRKPRDQQLAEQTGGTDYRTSKRQSSLYSNARMSGTY